MSADKSQMFFVPVQNIFEQKEKVVDKEKLLGLNVSNTEKDFDGKFIFSKVQCREPVGGANRCG